MFGKKNYPNHKLIKLPGCQNSTLANIVADRWSQSNKCLMLQIVHEYEQFLTSNLGSFDRDHLMHDLTLRWYPDPKSRISPRLHQRDNFVLISF